MCVCGDWLTRVYRSLTQTTLRPMWRLQAHAWSRATSSSSRPSDLRYVLYMCTCVRTVHVRVAQHCRWDILPIYFSVIWSIGLLRSQTVLHVHVYGRGMLFWGTCVCTSGMFFWAVPPFPATVVYVVQE